MPKNIAIKVQNLTKIYTLYKQPIDRLKESLHPLKKKYHKDFYALSNVSFEIKKGETVGIIGRNGSGKSTLLKIITSVLTPSSGRVIVHGKISAILELGSGFNPEMSGIENIYLNTLINGLNRKQTDNKINEIVGFAELGDFIHQPMKTYSSGMKARLAFAVAINIDPDILIVDEALSVGDAAFQRKCYAKMEQIRKNGSTILFVSHNEGSIVNLCNRAIWISNGKQIIDGTPKLVTGLYLKHINSKQISSDQIQKEYIGLDSTDNPEPAKEKKRQSEKAAQHKKAIEEFFSPALKPKSTVQYEEKGARISDVKITTLDGKKINVLVHGREYIYSYHVDVKERLENVQFGFLIKRKDGVALGGGVYPDKNSFIDFLDTNTQVNINFICCLNNGEYFFNAGIKANIENKHDYAHRVLDAYMIKVINAHKNITDTVNFIKKIQVKNGNL